jgi:glyoxylate/hydroxypyruvate reductase A
MTFLFLGDQARSTAMQTIFATEAPDIDFRVTANPDDLSEIEYLATWQAPDDIANEYPSLKVLFSTGAGVDQFDLDALPAGVELVRMIEPGIIAGMVEFCSFSVLALHRQMIDYRIAQDEMRWAPLNSPLARDRRVGVMGLGVLGRAVLAGLQPFGFQLSVWSRSAGNIPGVICHAGVPALSDFLATCDILICLLPLTLDTTGILCRSLFDKLPVGAGLINVGRGGHLVEPDLFDALNTGQLSGAILDVVDPEPLPDNHPFWSDKRIWLTPHIASMTDPTGAARALIANVRRHRAGQPMEGSVGRDRGY